MRSIYLLALTLLYIPIYSLDVSGNISSDTIWNTDSVKVVGNLTVDNGYTLTIEQGTNVHFTENYLINIAGRLLVNGAEGDSVNFSSFNDGPGWKKINFSNVDAANDSSIINYATFSNSNERAIYISYSNKVRVSNSNFRNNRNGAALIYNSSSEINNSTFENNFSETMGGGITIYNSTLNLNSNNFYNNSGDSGSALVLHNSQILMSNNNISNNSSSQYGALYFSDCSSSSILNSTISNNSSVTGGGIALIRTNIDITGSTIDNNSSNSGSAIYGLESTLNVVNSTIGNNSSTIYGSIYLDDCNPSSVKGSNIVNNSGNKGGGISLISSDLDIYNCNIAANDGNYGAGIYLKSNSDIELKNTIVYHNNISSYNIYKDDNLSDILIQYCDLESGTQSIFNNGGSFNGIYQYSYNSDPLFISKSDGYGDGYNGLTANWELQPESQLINKGILDTLGLHLPALDINGVGRVYNDIRVDIGSYELPGNHPQVTDEIDKTIDENSNLNFTPIVTEPEGDDIKFTFISGEVIGMTLDSLTGEFDWTPSYTQNGIYPIEILIEEDTAYMLKDTLTFEITVNNSDQHIVINSINPTAGGYCSGIENQPLLFNIDAFDPDGDDLSYEWKVNGVYVGNQTSIELIKSEGVYNVVLNSSDGSKNSITYNWEVAILPQEFQFESSLLTHTIKLPTGSFIVDGVEIVDGDYIGSFYLDDGELKCSGYGVFDSSLSTEFTIYGDDPLVGGKGGYNAGEELNWKLWRKDSKSQIICGAVYAAIGGDITADYYFLNGGKSGITDFLSDYQTIELADSWGMVSFNKTPGNSEISSILKYVEHDVIIVKDSDGKTFFPLYGIDEIGEIGIGEGYKIKMDNEHSLVLPGTNIDPENEMISIPDSSWSIISYLKETPSSIEDVVQGLGSVQGDLTDDIVIIKNGDGNVYFPSLNLNQIGNMLPGEAYLLYVTDGVDIIYSPNSKSSIAENKFQECEYFEKHLYSGVDMTLALRDCSGLTIGDEIAAVDLDGNIVGASFYYGEGLAITIMGDDPYTLEKDGLTYNDQFKLIHYDVETGLESEINDLTDNSYSTNKISYLDKVSGLEDNLPIATILKQNYPNPFNPDTTIPFVLSENGNIKIDIYNLKGELVSTLFNGIKSVGSHTIKWNGADSRGVEVGSGIYFVQMRTPSYSGVKRVTLLR